MNYGSDPADQIVRISLEGTEMVLKLSGLAAKNFALFVYAVLNDQQKVRGKTKLVRMLKERRPFKFFTVPEDRMKEFAKEAKDHGLLYTAIRNKQRPGQIELVVFADDAAKVNRILDNMGLDFVKAQSGEARFEEPGKEQHEKAPEQNAPGSEQPPETQTVQTPDGAVDFEVGAAEEAFNFTGEGDAQKEQEPENFTPGREQTDVAPAEKSPSEPSSPSSGSSSGESGGEQKPSVKQELENIRKEQAAKKEEKAKPPQRQNKTPGRNRRKKKKKSKGR